MNHCLRLTVYCFNHSVIRIRNSVPIAPLCVTIVQIEPLCTVKSVPIQPLCTVNAEQLNRCVYWQQCFYWTIGCTGISVLIEPLSAVKSVTMNHCTGNSVLIKPLYTVNSVLIEPLCVLWNSVLIEPLCTVNSVLA